MAANAARTGLDIKTLEHFHEALPLGHALALAYAILAGRHPVRCLTDPVAAPVRRVAVLVARKYIVRARVRAIPALRRARDRNASPGRLCWTSAKPCWPTEADPAGLNSVLLTTWRVEVSEAPRGVVKHFVDQGRLAAAVCYGWTGPVKVDSLALRWHHQARQIGPEPNMIRWDRPGRSRDHWMLQVGALSADAGLRMCVPTPWQG